MRFPWTHPMAFDAEGGAAATLTGAPTTPPTAPPAVTPPVAPPTSSTAWWSGKVDETTAGYLKNRGWDTKSADETALLAINAHRQAEKLIGAPAAQLLRFPTDQNDEAGWNAVHKRLGMPDAATDYDVSAVKFADGDGLNEAATDFFRNLAHSLKLPKDAAPQLASAVVKFLDNTSAADAAETTAALAEERKSLQSNWGAKFDANMFVARNAAAKLGVTPEEVAALESVRGYAKTMEMFRSIGERMGEARFVSGDPGTAPGVMTRDQAQAKKSELMSDTAWVKRYMEGGAAEKREMMALNTLIVGDDTASSRRR